MSKGSGLDSGALPAATGNNVAGGNGFRVLAKRFARNRVALVGLIVLGLLVLVAVLAPFLVKETAYDNPALTINLRAGLQGPSGAHLLGTDDLGRDELARVLVGTQLSMLLALVTLLVATVLGAAVLALSALAARARFSMVARVFAVVSTPLFIVVLLVGTGIVKQLPLLSDFVELIRVWVSITLSDLNGELFVGAWLLITLFLVGEMARFGYLLFRSLRPARPAHATAPGRASGTMPALSAVLGPAAVTGLWIAGDAVLVQNVLVFSGIDAAPPLEPLSLMVADGATALSMQPLLYIVPLALVLLIVVCVNVVGFGLRSALRGNT